MFKFVDDLKRVNSLKSVSKQQAAEQMASIELPSFLAMISRQMPWIVVAIIWIGSAFSTITFIKTVLVQTQGMDSWIQLLALSFTPVIFGLTYVGLSGCLSMIGRPGVIAGKFPRSPAHPIYALRRIYGTAWTQVYYFKALYSAFLAVPLFKRILFLLFGYRGNSDFTIYPDAWIRDLPLLRIGKGVYIANRCTIGTNICLNDGSIIVGECRLDDKVLIGHMVVFGLGCHFGESSELGIGVTFGIRITLGKSVMVAPKANIYHGAKIGDNVKVGACSLIGMKAEIGPNIDLPLGSYIPNGAKVLTQKDADRYFSAESQDLQDKKSEMLELLRNNLDGTDLETR